MRKRAVGAIIIILVFAGAGVAAGVESEPDMHPYWNIPPLQPGDQGRYTTEDGLAFVFAVEATMIPLRTGVIGPALAIHVQGEAWDSPVPRTVMTTWIDPDGNVIAGRNWTDGFGSFAGTSVGEVTLRTGSSYDLWETAWGESHLPCGLVHDGQGRNVTGVIVAAGCQQVFTPEGVEFVSGGATLQLADGVSVPEWLDWLGNTWRLANFTRGSAIDNTHSISYEVSTQSGVVPDDAGIEMEFTLQEAVAFARSPGLGLRLGAFLERPGAYLAAASFTTQYEPGTRERSWTLIASDGFEEVAAVFSKQMAQGDRTTAGLPIGTGHVTPDGPVVHWSDIEAPMTGFPTKDRLPLHLPTVASVQDLREAAYGERRVDAWGFAHPCDGCDSSTVWVGEHARFWFEPQGASTVCVGACASGNNLLIQDTLAVDEDGLPVHRGRTDYVYYRQAEAGAPIIDAGEREHAPSGLMVADSAVPSFEITRATVGLSIAGLLLAAAYYFAPALKNGFVGTLFSRVTRAKALHHPLRSRIMDLVDAEPGVHVASLARALDASESTLRHHLKQMEAAGLIRTVLARGYRCVFAAKSPRAPVETAGAARSEPSRALLALVRVEPGRTMGELATHVGMSPSQTTYHVGRLVEAGLLERRKEGRSVRIFPGHAAA